MIGRGLGVVAALIVAAPLGAPGRRPSPKAARGAPAFVAPEGSLASIAVPRVDVLFREGAALVTLDVTVARGTWKRGEIPIHFAYGAPGVPIAFDAKLTPLEPGRFFAADDAPFVPLASAHVASAPREASLAFGPRTLAGEVVRVGEDVLAAAFDRSLLADLRVRVVHALPRRAADVVVRIAPPDGDPPPLGVVQVRSDASKLARASASLCAMDPAAPERPLAIPGFAASPPLPPPSFAKRTPGESLCVAAALVPP